MERLVDKGKARMIGKVHQPIPCLGAHKTHRRLQLLDSETPPPPAHGSDPPRRQPDRTPPLLPAAQAAALLPGPQHPRHGLRPPGMHARRCAGGPQRRRPPGGSSGTCTHSPLRPVPARALPALLTPSQIGPDHLDRDNLLQIPRPDHPRLPPPARRVRHPQIQQPRPHRQQLGRRLRSEG